MIRYRTTAIAALMLLATPAAAQNAETRPSITVMGRGHVEAPPDSFRISAELQGRGPDQVTALRALAAVQSRVGDVQKLEGLERARLTTGAPSVSPTFDPECGGDGYNRDTDDCPIVGYVAAMSLTLEAAPVARAGDALSLASERGARNASVQSFYLADDAGQTVTAQRAAFNDARRQADSLAAASNQRIVRLLRLEDPTAQDYAPVRLQVRAVNDVVVTGNRIRATVSLDVAPPPVRTEAQIVATFEIE
jgi:uncharacterized protein